MNRTEQGVNTPQPNAPSDSPMEPGKKPMEDPIQEPPRGTGSMGSWTGDTSPRDTEQEKPKVDPDGQQPS
jgi:hypothetical protein